MRMLRCCGARECARECVCVRARAGGECAGKRARARARDIWTALSFPLPPLLRALPLAAHLLQTFLPGRAWKVSALQKVHA